MPFSLEEITFDADLGQSFQIVRTYGQFGAGGWVPASPQLIDAFGVISVADSKSLEMIPEGDRPTGALHVISNTRIYTTSESAALISDQIQWRNNSYRTISLGQWIDYGFYAALMVRMTGS